MGDSLLKTAVRATSVSHQTVMALDGSSKSAKHKESLGVFLRASRVSAEDEDSQRQGSPLAETKEEIDCPRDKLVDELIKRGCQVGGTTSAPAAPAAAAAPAAPPVVAADAGPRGPAVALRGPEDGLYIADWDEAGVALSYGFGGGTVPSKSGSV